MDSQLPDLSSMIVKAKADGASNDSKASNASPDSKTPANPFADPANQATANVDFTPAPDSQPSGRSRALADLYGTGPTDSKATPAAGHGLVEPTQQIDLSGQNGPLGDRGPLGPIGESFDGRKHGESGPSGQNDFGGQSRNPSTSSSTTHISPNPAHSATFPHTIDPLHVPSQPAAPGTPEALTLAMADPFAVIPPLAASPKSHEFPAFSTGLPTAEGFPKNQGSRERDYIDPLVQQTASLKNREAASEASTGNVASEANAGPAGTAAGESVKPEQLGPLPKKSRYKPRNKGKPKAPADIAEFAAIWSDPTLSVREVAKLYGRDSATLRAWAKDFDLPNHPIPIPTAPEEPTQAVKRMWPGDEPPAQVLSGHTIDPTKDEEIMDGWKAIEEEARMVSGHSDLQPIQRKLTRLSLLVVAKAPIRTWEGMANTLDSLSKSVLNTRRIEAMIPRGDADPVMLRKEAASQLLSELQSVLKPEEQAVLAKVMKAGADRLIAKGRADGTQVTPVDFEGNA